MMTITGDLNIYPHLSCLSLSLLFPVTYISACIHQNIPISGLSVSLSLFVCMCTRFVCIITCPVLVLCHCNADPLIHLLMISSTSFCGSGLNCQWMHGMMAYIPSARIRG